MSIFIENEAYRPFTYPWAVEAEKRHSIDMFWHEGQLDLQDDLIQWHMKDGLKTKNYSHEHNKALVGKLLLFFTQLEIGVAGGYIELLPYIKNDQIRSLLLVQAAKEVRHKRGYAIAGETFGFTNSDWVAFQKHKELMSKVEILNRNDWDLNTKVGVACKLLQVLLGEGIGLFGAFGSLLNFKRFGLLMGFNVVNAWSLAEEQEHVDNNIKVLQHILEECSSEEVDQIKKVCFELIDAYVSCEQSVIDMLGEQEGIDMEAFKGYMSYLGRLRAFQIGFIGKLELGGNPMPWMDDMLGAVRLGAFFETKVVDYSHKKLEGNIDYTKYQNILDNNI